MAELSFEDRIRQMMGGTSSTQLAPVVAPPPPAPTYAPPNISPEATTSVNRGGSVGNPPAADEPQDFGARIQQTMAPAPTVQNSATASAPPIAYKKQIQDPSFDLRDASKTLGDYVKGQGYQGTFAVGGWSPQDNEINRLTDAINRSTNPAEQQSLAQQMFPLLQQRASTVVNGAGNYDPATGQIIPFGGTPAPKTGGSPSGGGGGAPSSSGGGGGAPGVVSSPNASLLRQLQELMAAGGVTDELKATQESQLISDVERGSQRKRQSLADQLAARGVFGGAAVDQLNDLSGDADFARASGLADIRSQILGLQNKSRETAMASILEQMGMASDEAQAQARLMLDSELGRGRLALDTQALSSGRDIERQRLALDTSRTQSAQDIQRAQLAQDQDQFLRGLGLNEQELAVARERLGLDRDTSTGNLALGNRTLDANFQLERERQAAQADQFLRTLGLNERELELAKQRLGLDTLNVQQGGDAQRGNLLISLLTLENLVDEQDRAGVREMIDRFLLEEDITRA